MTTWKLNMALLTLALTGLGASSPAAERAVLHDRVDATEPVSFNVYVPLRNRAALDKDLESMHTPGAANFQHWLTPAEFHAKYGPTTEQVQKIQDRLASYGLQSSVSAGRLIHVTGSGSAVEQALGTQLKHGTFANGKPTLAATQQIVVPDALREANAVVTGLTGKVNMRTHAHRAAMPDNRYRPTGGYWFDDIKEAYSFPSYQTYTGKGVTIGILMSGDFNPPDMALYFGHEHLPVPKMSTVQIDGGAKYNANGDSFETHLDLQQSGGVAPDASLLLYNIPDLSDEHIIDGLTHILEDNATDVVSMSFGGAELYYTPGDNGGTDFTYLLQIEDDLFAQGNAQGITFIASSGDSGALEAIPVGCFGNPSPPNCGNFLLSASFPATSPHVTAVGGTNLITTYTKGSLDSTYVRESAYADPLAKDIFYGTTAVGGYWGSGGGDSILFKRPSYQKGINTGNAMARTIPDLSGHMGGCPGGVLGACNPDDSYDLEVIAGGLYGVIGTSASAPDFAGLTALTIQRFNQRMGNENFYIYGLAKSQKLGLLHVYNQTIPGNNGYYSTNPAKPGYDRVLGLGTVLGNQFLIAPNPAAVAGTPQTPSNP